MAAEAAEASTGTLGGMEAGISDRTESIPTLFTRGPPISDTLMSDTKIAQQETIDECLPYLKGEQHENLNHHGIPRLDRKKHVKFLSRQLGKLPGAFKGADPSRPWIFYWCLGGLSLLGEDVDIYRTRLVETVRPFQNATGGFGGGFGQTSHLATTYATILSLALVGGEGAYEVVDRRAMWKWLCSLKQPDGGFQMAVGGEEDVRGAYCAAVIVSLLNLPLDLSTDSPARSAGHDQLFSGLAEWIGSCQSFEGGISPKPGREAHGGYAFCALGCLAILDSPHRAFPRYLDIDKLIAWLSSRQYAPEGGFSGRTNKLVDGCYSHWIGGCWPLVEAGLSGPQQSLYAAAGRPSATADTSLFSRNGLVRYILCCCQDESPRGGMRDKPSKGPDAYHTCYVLGGLSSAQHKWDFIAARADEVLVAGDKWTASPFMAGEQIFDEEDRLRTTHPVYVIPQHCVEEIQAYFASKPGF